MYYVLERASPNIIFKVQVKPLIKQKVVYLCHKQKIMETEQTFSSIAFYDYLSRKDRKPTFSAEPVMVVQKALRMVWKAVRITYRIVIHLSEQIKKNKYK